ncbi:MAG: FMN-binding protein [Halioglobus sp.]|nr:FMN-binding protein [Halioglobus sp.]
MQAPGQTDNPLRAASWPMYRALVGVGMLCGLLIVSVYVLTLPAITRNETRALQQAVFQVLPGAVARTSFVLTAAGHFREAAEGDDPARMVHAGYTAEGQLAGIAIEGRAMGYQDVIRILYGYAPQQQVVVGMQVLASKETPGLGDRIEKDAGFRANFTALDVTLAADGVSLEHPVEAVKNGTRTAPWQIDGITGATISSSAVAGILNRSSAQWIPVIHQRQADFMRPEATDDQR